MNETVVYTCDHCLDLLFDDGYLRWHHCGSGDLRRVGVMTWDNPDHARPLAERMQAVQP